MKIKWNFQFLQKEYKRILNKDANNLIINYVSNSEEDSLNQENYNNDQVKLSLQNNELITDKSKNYIQSNFFLEFNKTNSKRKSIKK